MKEAVPTQTVLLIDDSPQNLASLRSTLKDTYRVIAVREGKKAVEIAQNHPQPDIILVDVMMPDMDGYEVCVYLKNLPHTEHIPIIFVTASTDIESEKLGFDLGAADYITKPISPPRLRARIANHLLLKKNADTMKEKNAELGQLVEQRTEEIVAVQDVAILAMASLAETRDSETGNHIRRTQLYIKILAESLRSQGYYTDLLTDQYIETLYKTAPLHDIGKVGIPDKILLKPGRFTDDEFKVMKTHAELGFRAIKNAEDSLGVRLPFLQIAKEIARYHHERWNGNGYPLKIAGESIPLSARLMALADVYDALISRRVYKEPMSHELAAAIIYDERGDHFDPTIIDIFSTVEDAFKKVAHDYADHQDDIDTKKESLNSYLSHTEKK
ncbi:HD-GYP domain-containing protein [Chitinivibrio alkaliphilus]|uniref:Response regulator n=1 Tax=Chitinivibrio alkaliphilus ACht1 TaxID=1313304 RepID=U7D4G4_9BACT|nr:two-component system response regulator [Chitinivibrio alkaliphilus]ERP31389.1 response regulator [Chitinivibrio alkaliphilus ACht1]